MAESDYGFDWVAGYPDNINKQSIIPLPPRAVILDLWLKFLSDVKVSSPTSPLSWRFGRLNPRPHFNRFLWV